MKVYVGYDAREAEAFHVCKYSIERHSDAEVIALRQQDLRKAGLYKREERRDAMGTRLDAVDGKPFSTEFSFTRFLVPFMQEEGWALFCDGDFLFTRDLAELFSLKDPSKAVMVVQHDHQPSEQAKMDDIPQTRYARKNWSSLVLWNCSHEANKRLKLADVNTRPGYWLHGFHWLKDEEIGALPIEWNWLAGVSPPFNQTPAGIHYTLGIPALFREMDGVQMPLEELWLAEWARMRLTQRSYA